MYHTTGLTREQADDVVAAVFRRHPELAVAARSRGGNRALGFFRRVHLTIVYLKLNICQEALAEFFETSQSTVSRVICTFTEAVGEVLSGYVPTGDDLDPGEQLIIDGTLLPCWSWHDHRELYSGKHHTTGHNVQVAVRADGMLMWVSDPLPGSVNLRRVEPMVLHSSGQERHNLVSTKPGTVHGEKTSVNRYVVSCGPPVRDGG